MSKAFKLQNGLLVLSTEAPGGVYNSAQLKKIAALCDGETAVVKATEDQRLALFVAEAQVAKVADELKAVGLGVRHYQDGLHQPVNCLGELCPEHAQDAMGAGMDLAKELATLKLASPLKIGVNGCARVCVATHTLDVSIIGDTNGYRISLGGKNSQIPEMASFMAEGVPADKLPKLIAKVIAIYKELAQPDESLQDVMERAGTKRFVEALHPFSQDAAAQDDPFAGVGAEAAPAADDVKIEELPEPEAFDGPNFDDVGPEAEQAGGDEPLVPIEALDDGALRDADLSLEEVPPAPDDDLMLEEVPLDGGADATLAAPELAPVADDDGLVLQEIPAAGPVAADDELDFEELQESVPPAAKSVVAAVADELEGELLADEVGEDEADAFEAKLNESIAEEESMPDVEDLNSTERLEAMKLVEAGSDLPNVEAVHEILETDGSFDNLEIELDDGEVVEASLGEAELVGDDEELEAETPEAPRAAAAPAAVSRVGFELGGVDVTADGCIVLTFASGANVTIDPRTLKAGARRDLVVGGKRVGLKTGPNGLSVEVDGVTLFLPRRAA